MIEQAPTILIGLGGIGSRIVNKIYAEIPESRRKKVAIHAFDTDVNSIKHLNHIGKHVTQTSTRKSVGEYLHEYPNLKKWFPEHPELLKKTMTEGAGQVRAVSRLAFMSAIAEGKLNNVLKDIEAIFPVHSGGYEQGVRVIIISSLAGGTGSGIYLQVALYLREILQERFGERVLVRGAFLLPDVITRTGTLDSTEWESVRANGYASLKELEAITQSVHNQGDDGVTIQLEYRPNQVDLHNRMDHAISEKPFNFVFLYDYENTRGQHLRRVKDYEDQIARSIYLQLFSPISDKHFSQEDNQIKQLIDSEGKGIYCGAGVATLTYPYEEILEYCALNWSSVGLDENWLKLDDLFEEEKKQYDEDIRNGIHREKLDRGNSYISNMLQLGSSEAKQPDMFFKEMMRQTHEVHQNNQLGAPKSLRFIQAVEEHIQRTLGQDGDLRISRARCEAKDNRLENKETAASEISDVETGLKLYEDQINKKVYEYRTMITHQVVFQDYDKESKVSGNDFSLNTWILQKGVPLHPVSTRFFLYETKLRLTNKLRELRQNNDNLRKRIKGYAKAYDLEETEQVEDAKTRLEQTLDQGLISRLINNKFKDFIQTYKEQSIGHLRNLDNYKKELLTELVFQSVLEHIESLIEVYETFFINLRDVKVKLEKTIQQKARQFEEKANPTEEYVLATKELQEELWKRIRAAETDDLLPDDISREIYVNLYDQFYQREKLRFKQDVKGINVEQFYHDHVVNYCYNKLKNDPVIDLDYDVITALRKEAQFLQKDEDAHIEERVHRLNHLAYPFIPNINNRRELKFWGVHDDIKEQLSEVDRTNLFAENAIFDPAFSKYEIVRYTAHYGLEIHDFSKFSDGEQSASIRKSPGVYYESYYRTISKLNRGEPAVTPHLDKNWHLPAYMPDLNPSQKELDERKINRAFLLGLMYDLFQVSKEQGEEIFLYTGGDYSSFIVQGGKRVPNQLYRLHEALFFNPAIYDEILDIAEETMEKNRQQYLDMEAHRFIQGAKKLTNLRNERINNIFDVVFHYEMEKIGDPKLEERAERLREQLLEEIKNYYGTMYGNQQRRAMQDAAKLIETLWNESAVRKTVDPDSARYIRWKTQIEREFADFQVRL